MQDPQSSFKIPVWRLLEANLLRLRNNRQRTQRTYNSCKKLKHQFLSKSKTERIPSKRWRVYSQRPQSSRATDSLEISLEERAEMGSQPTEGILLVNEYKTLTVGLKNDDVNMQWPQRKGEQTVEPEENKVGCQWDIEHGLSIRRSDAVKSKSKQSVNIEILGRRWRSVQTVGNNWWIQRWNLLSVQQKVPQCPVKHCIFRN